MLRFAIGLGTSSVSGRQLELALADVYSLDDFEIILMVERENELTNLSELQKRAVEFAKRMKSDFDAGTYFGLAGGQVKFCLELKGPSAAARTDMVAAIVNHKLLEPRFLDVADIHWQLKERVCAHVSTERAISDLVTLIGKHCAIKALPRPM